MVGPASDGADAVVGQRWPTRSSTPGNGVRDPSGPLVGYTTGVYDMFHIGHLNLLRRASSMVDRLIVGVTTDELAESRKRKRPGVPWVDRSELRSRLRFVDHVVHQASMDKMAAWEEHGFHVMFVGDDWKGTPAWVKLEEE